MGIGRRSFWFFFCRQKKNRLPPTNPFFRFRCVNQKWHTKHMKNILYQPFSDFYAGRKIVVSDKMQQGYVYYLQENPAENFAPDFTPELTPLQMLQLGVFEGHYLNDCCEEFPKEWFILTEKNRSENKPDIRKNCFGVKARLGRKEWVKRGWIFPFDPDPRGWFQWYCRYWLGRRIPDIDARQIHRWKAFKRHQAQVIKNCPPQDLSCRRKQRQALLQWAYNPFL